MKPASLSNSAEAAFAEIVGREHVLAALADSITGLHPRFIVEPGTERELSSALRLANDANLAAIPRGGGTKINWGNPPARADLILSTARLNKIIEHAWADLTVTVEAGCTIATLQAALAQHGQRLELDPLWPEKATIGGVLSTNDSGALRLRFGALRDLIIGVTLALPDGTLASSGGKVVKNVAGYDLPKLVTGALGTLGVITRAVFRLHPLPRNSSTFSISPRNFEQAQRLLSALLDSKLAHTALQARIAGDSQPILDILFEGTEAGIAEQVAQAKKMAESTAFVESPATVWGARQKLWDDSDSATIAKVCILPAQFARTSELMQRTTEAHQAGWQFVMQATGIGWLRLEGAAQNLHAVLFELRSQFERDGGSLVILRRPSEMPTMDAWGQPSDALPLMRAVKHRFDAKNTLNPGRFVGGI